MFAAAKGWPALSAAQTAATPCGWRAGALRLSDLLSSGHSYQGGRYEFAAEEQLRTAALIGAITGSANRNHRSSRAKRSGCDWRIASRIRLNIDELDQEGWALDAIVVADTRFVCT